MTRTEIAPPPPELPFPSGFGWGTATAAYQVEGAVREDGRTPSIWDTFSHLPGRTAGGDTGDVADDHYHRLHDDVALMAQLGLQTYRFSVSWPRITPQVTADALGPVNPVGMGFYSALVDELLAAGITPALTLYHWDLPQALEDAGGWAARATAHRFGEFAAAVAGALGDRVPLFLTLNEPFCSAFLGYAAGVHAPGRTEPAAALAAVHHLNLAHGLATAAIRAAAPRARVAIAHSMGLVRPQTGSAADADAARRVDGLLNRVFLDPILHGSYPADVLADTAGVSDWGFVRPGDLEVISAPLDALGVNYYRSTLVRHWTRERPREHADSDSDSHSDSDSDSDGDGDGDGARSPWIACDDVEFPHQPGPTTDMGWGIDPGGLTEVLLRAAREAPQLDLLVTENGAAYPDGPDADGRVADAERIEYLRSHLVAVHDAISAGARVTAYYVWSLLDNFEWAAGYAKRFGIVHVDFATLARTPKDSAHFLSRVIRRNAVPGPGSTR